MTAFIGAMLRRTLAGLGLSVVTAAEVPDAVLRIQVQGEALAEDYQAILGKVGGHCFTGECTKRVGSLPQIPGYSILMSTSLGPGLQEWLVSRYSISWGAVVTSVYMGKRLLPPCGRFH
ncbi:MAG: hypothetical protein ACYCZF_13620 [Anaerolineae bacterium]